MGFHAENGREFVGLRRKAGVGKQVVYDKLLGKRVLLNIIDNSVKDTLIEDALREGISSKNVLKGVIAALQARAIEIDYSF